jgi:hypothetical protein
VIEPGLGGTAGQVVQRGVDKVGVFGRQLRIGGHRIPKHASAPGAEFGRVELGIAGQHQRLGRLAPGNQRQQFIDPRRPPRRVAMLPDGSVTTAHRSAAASRTRIGQSAIRECFYHVRPLPFAQDCAFANIHGNVISNATRTSEIQQAPETPSTTD